MNQKNEKLGKTLKNTFQDWILDSTSHGFPKIFKTNRITLKIIWTLCLCVCIGLCAYLVTRSITDYLQYDVTTIIRKTTEIPIELPAISICHNEMFLTQSGRDFLLKTMNQIKISNSDDILNSSFLEYIFPSKYQESWNLENLDYIGRINALSYNLTNSIRKSIGFSLSDFMNSCYAGGSFCKDEDLVWYFDAALGSCYLLNSGKFENGSSNSIFKQNNVGLYYGYRLEFLDLNKWDDLNFYKGLKITLYDHKTKVNTLRGIDIPSQFQTNIVIKKRKFKKMPIPYSECINDHSNFKSSDIYQATLNESEIYSQDICYRVCYQAFLISKCKCADPNRPFFKPVESCWSWEQFGCVYEVFNEFFFIFDIKEKCSNHCPLECEKTEYDYSLSFTNFPTDLQAKAIHKSLLKRNSSKNYTLDEIKKNSLQINIYYDQLMYETIEETSKMELVDLISNIGGLLGLFIGISILSFAELIEIFIEILFVLYEYKKRSLSTKIEHQENI
ncbi:unnamed protein product [Brachionus calyciflorus]|uniref:Uncharacterized protein n=1 Tax=Brachionus calyciflorus TaxID=104777 RepID=A0A814EW92_9BILA|nr:unnamed protein product [Brachionus calyciflorus]